MLETMAANLRRLTDLLLDEGYDEQFLRPSRAAFETTWSLLVAADASISPRLPLASPAPVGDGGILVQWQRGERTVFLAVPADPSQGYLYLRGPEFRQTVRELADSRLISALEWLTEE